VDFLKVILAALRLRFDINPNRSATMPISPGKQGGPRGSPSAKILPPQLRTAASSSSYYSNNDFENVWLEEMLTHERQRNESRAKADLLNFTELPGSTVHPHAANQLAKQAKVKSSSLPEHERQRLNELSKTLTKTTMTTKTKTKNPYVEANAKLTRVLQHTKLRCKNDNMQASQLNDFYKLGELSVSVCALPFSPQKYISQNSSPSPAVTRETSAAVILQSQCRRILATEYVNRVALETKSATIIQCFVRSFFAQQQLRRLKEEKENASLVRERFVRLFVARCRRRKRIKVEHDAAVVCQSAIRVFFAKQIARLERLQLSWELNQKRWRAISTRLAWADLRINFYARQIQCIVRRKLAKRRVATMFEVHTEASIRIQCIWRRYLTRKRLSGMIYQLNVDQRCNKIRIISSEHRYWKQRVEELTKPSKLQIKNDLEEQKAKLEQEQSEKCEQIHLLESHYRDQLELQRQITPRAIAGGWEEQIQINLKDARERITNAKLDLFFDVQKKLKAVTKEIDLIQSNEDEAKANLDHWSAWQQAEQDRLWDFQREHDREVEEEEKRHARVHEQLKWAIKFTMPSGKPDKRRPLRHQPTDNDGGERVEKLIDVVRLSADGYQEQVHLANTFNPFVKMWQQYNALATNQNLLAKPGDNGATMKPNPSHYGVTSQPHSTEPRQKRTFPKKLPFDRLEKVREERTVLEGEQSRWREQTA